AERRPYLRLGLPREARFLSYASVLASAVLLAAPVATDTPGSSIVGKTVAEVRVFDDGRLTSDPTILELVETRPGQPLSMRQVRETITHLFSLGAFVDVQFSGVPSDGGVRLRYDLIPAPAGGVGVEIRGDLGRPVAELLGPITRRFGTLVPAEDIPALVVVLEELYRDVGRFSSQIKARPGASTGAVMVDIDPGPVARIEGVTVTGRIEREAAVLDRLELQPGNPYDPPALEERLVDYERELRARRFYEARVSHQAIPTQDGLAVRIRLNVDTGAQVTVIFDRDPVPGGDLDSLVPVAREGSIDEDLLEDSSRRIEEYLNRLGFRDARVTHRRLDEAEGLSIVFSVDRGAEYRVDEIVVRGAEVLSAEAITELLAVTPGGPLVVSEVDLGVAAIATAYAELGHRDINVEASFLELDPPAANRDFDVVDAQIVLDVVEGPATTIGSVRFEGATVFSASEMAALVAVAPGAPYYGPLVRADVTAILTRYLNQGFENVQVQVVPRFDETGQTADVLFQVKEGSQILVDHVLIVGNRQISSTTIRDEVTLRSGEPLGRGDIDETYRRLTGLGLFRGIELREFSHGAGNRRDVVVVVEEAPATRVGYGGGLSATQRLRATEGGPAAERLEFAPRGFFEIGRRNLWGKNRSIDLFTRVSLRGKDDVTGQVPTSSLGFNQYRFLLNYREPRAFGRTGDLSVSGFVEQVIRPSFDLFSRGVNAQFQQVVGRTMTGRVGYTYGLNRVTNEQLLPEDRPLVDRLFPEVTLSIFSAGLVRDTRNDPLEPTDGALLAVDVETAFRGLGSAVGFAKTVLQGRFLRELPGEMVLATAARLGLARGFALMLPAIPTFVLTDEGILVQQDGDQRAVIQSLPASERFFAGGDSTVRGFALDRLGDGPTIDANGFPTGGNAMVVLNSELRVPLTGPLQVVGFLDAGNVFDRVSNMRLARVRGAAGFGVRYRSPIGPIRVDLGFKLDRQEFAGERERLTALHLSIGQAF
ncbi:MAG: POTRA domain-containing protein, partial [Acidobacteriota bacterium]|nr:POTRA domain-containing protein [Acidobacteriota bacterium]